MKKGLLTIGMTALAAVTLVGCSSGSSDSDVETITFINHKTDWETNGKWDEYIAKFNEKYPDIKVEVQTITDYAGQMKTRMNSKEYGDVLMIPGDISPKDYENFFEYLVIQKNYQKNTQDLMTVHMKVFNMVFRAK